MRYNLATAEGQQARLDVMNGESFEVAPDCTPLDFMLAIMRDSAQPMKRRTRMAVAAAPFVHPKLEARANFNIDEASLKARLFLARKRRRLQNKIRTERGVVGNKCVDVRFHRSTYC